MAAPPPSSTTPPAPGHERVLYPGLLAAELTKQVRHTGCI